MVTLKVDSASENPVKNKGFKVVGRRLLSVAISLGLAAMLQ
jgi:hypothetical protein